MFPEVRLGHVDSRCESFDEGVPHVFFWMPPACYVDGHIDVDDDEQAGGDEVAEDVSEEVEVVEEEVDEVEEELGDHGSKKRRLQIKV